MTPPRPPIGELATAGIADMIGAARATPGLFVLFLAAAAGAAYVEESAADALGLPSAMDFVLTLAASSLFAALVAVALHRFVILSETNSVASLLARGRIVFDFAAVLFGAQFLIMLPTLLAASIWGRQEDMPVWAPPACIGLAIIGFFLLLRSIMVFPAIAIDAPDRSLATALARSRGLILRIVLASLLAMLLISVIGAIALAPLLLLGLRDDPTVTALFSIVAEVVISAAAVAIVSRAYLWSEGRWPPADR